MHNNEVNKHVNIKVYGNIQGVYFRTHIEDSAKALDINGFVQNQPDGTVYIEAEGAAESVDRFIKKTKQGSDMSIVKRTIIREGPIKDFVSFRIKH
ncbi:MAG: acylphosphatase [Patescibacteria group bacterium]